jgi:putative transposase
MENDLSATKALSHLGLSWTRRTANNTYRRFKQQGFKGLIDKRWLRQPATRVFTDEVKALTLYWFCFRSAAGPVAIWEKVLEICKERGIAAPCQTTVKEFLAHLPEGLKLFRQGKPGIREWEQTARPVIRYENTTYANELWQGDHSPLRIWVKVKVNGKWKPFKAYITLLLDSHTRAIPGHVVSTKYPDAWTIALAFRRAILPQEDRKSEICGIPKVFESDRGRDFISIAITATLGGLGCMPCPDPPYYPNSKGKCERFFLTLDKGCLRLLAGHMDAIGVTEGAALKRVHELLTLQQLDKEIAIWIDQKYHKRKHSETRRAPAEHWKETVLLHMPKSEDDLNLLLLKYDKTCRICNTGIKFSRDGIRHRFWSPELADYFRRDAMLRYNPEDMDSVLVYCAATSDFLCEAFDMLAENPRYTIDDVKQTRSQYRRGVLERMKCAKAPTNWRLKSPSSVLMLPLQKLRRCRHFSTYSNSRTGAPITLFYNEESHRRSKWNLNFSCLNPNRRQLS